jgi:hypothetical protein
MEEFGYKGGYKFHGAWQCGYPLIGLGGIAAFLPLVRDGYAEFKAWAPLLVIGLIGWLIYEIIKVSSRFKFLLRISEEAIQVGDGPKVEWENVERAEFHGFGFGKTPIITLVTQSGEKIEIPAAIQNLQYIQGIIQKKVADIKQPTD